MPNYRFTDRTAHRLKSMLEVLGEVGPGLELLNKSRKLIYDGQDEEGIAHQRGLAPCLQKLAEEAPLPARKFHRASLSQLIEYKSTFRGRDLSYLTDLLTAINTLIIHTINKDESYYGPKLKRKGVVEFEFPQSPEDKEFSEWFEPATTTNYRLTHSSDNNLRSINSEKAHQYLKISNLLLRVDYSKQVSDSRDIVNTLSPACGIVCTASDELIQKWMTRRIVNSLEIHNIKIKNAKIYPIESQLSPIRANYEYFWDDFARSLGLSIGPQKHGDSNFVEAVLNQVCVYLQTQSVIVVVYGMDNLTPNCQKFIINDVFKPICQRLEQVSEKRGNFRRKLMPRFVLLVSDGDARRRAYSCTDLQSIQTPDIPVALEPLTEIIPAKDVTAWLCDEQVQELIERLGRDYEKVCDDLDCEHHWVKTDPAYVLQELCSVFGQEYRILSFENYWRLAG